MFFFTFHAKDTEAPYLYNNYEEEVESELPIREEPKLTDERLWKLIKSLFHEMDNNYE